ncbi:B12-binding domain-containing radical SAM protein [bacterium]|nr:B12-binding domain-containing radical SAM protein [bacterium]
MNILLINPLIRERDLPRNIPHGIAILASVLREKGYNVILLDINGCRYSKEEVRSRLKSLDYDVVGIGGLIPVYREVKWLSETIKAIHPGIPIIVGGSVGFSVPELVLQRTGVDIVCNQEGEMTLPEIFHAIETGSKLDSVKGIWFKKDGQTVKTPERELIRDLDTIPFPAWDLLPMDVYLNNPVVGVGRDIDFISSRGCPYQCTFCFRAFGRKYRPHSVDYIVEAIKFLKRDYSIDFVSFQDDEFIATPKRVEEFCERLQRADIRIKWSATGRVNLANRELYKRAKEAGCVSISYGIESGSQRMLDSMKKGVTVEQAKEAISLNREVGLRLPTSFIVGMPGETGETAWETVEFCKETAIPLKGLMFATPYPGTELFEYALKNNKIKGDIEDFILRLGDAVDFTVNLTDAFTDDELIALREEMIEEVNLHYRPPSTEEMERFNIELYGEELYRRAQRQVELPAFKKHRELHGFNE